MMWASSVFFEYERIKILFSNIYSLSKINLFRCCFGSHVRGCVFMGSFALWCVLSCITLLGYELIESGIKPIYAQTVSTSTKNAKASQKSTTGDKTKKDNGSAIKNQAETNKNQSKNKNQASTKTNQGTRTAPSSKRIVGKEKALANDRVAVQKRSSTHKGAIGLSETFSADTGPQGTLRLSLFAGGFQSDSFLVPKEEDTFSITYLALAYTPIPMLEVYANTRAMSHFNRLNTPNTLQSQGDLNVGVKGSKFWHTVGAGMALDTQFYSGIGGGFNLSATNVNVHALFTVDLLKHNKNPIPFRFLLDIQYTFENSEALFANLPEEPNLIQEWGFQSARYDRLTLHFGLEAPTEYVSIFTEYHIGTPFLVEMTRLGRYANVLAFESVPHSINLGARSFVKEHIALEFSTHFGLSDQPTTGVPATPPWMIWAGLTYILDPRPEVIEREIKIPPPPPKKVKPVPLGTLLTLTVLDKSTKKPIENAQVTYIGQSQSTQHTNAKGKVTGYRFPATRMSLRIQAEGYQTRTVKVSIPKNKPQLSARLSLKPGGESGQAKVQIQLAAEVIEARKQKPFALALYGPKSFKSTLLDQGYQQKVPPGEYVLTLSNDGVAVYYTVIVLGAGGVSQKTIKLSDLNGQKAGQSSQDKTFHKKKNRWAGYDLKRKKLYARRSIQFKGDSARLTSSSRKVVKGIAELVGKEARIKKIKVYVYTHSIGSSKKDKRLGVQRGTSIKQVLKNEGVDPARISIISYGSSRNTESNFTKRGREKNQKVRFGIQVRKPL